jgi:hypothetical protein
MVEGSFLSGQPLSPAIPEVRKGPSRFLQVTSDRSRGSQTPSSDAALVARGSGPQPPTTHKTAPSTWTCSNHAAPQATSAVISPLLAQDCLTRLCLITLRSTLDPILLRRAVRKAPAGQMPACPSWRPPPGLRPPVRCPLNPLCRPGSKRPAVRCPACPVSGHLLPRPDPAVRPSGVQPVRRPAVWCPPLRPVAAVWSHVSRMVGMGDTSVRRDQRHDRNQSSSRWSGPVPRRRLMGLSRPGCGTVAEVEWRPAGRWPGTGGGGAWAGGCGPTG